MPTNDSNATVLRTVMVDSIPVQTTDAGAAVITRLQGDIATLTKAIADGEAEHKATLEAAEKRVKDAEAKVITDAELDKRVAARAALVTDARKVLADYDPAGKSDATIRKDVVTHVRGADKVAGKDAAWFDAAFDLAVEAAATKATDTGGGDTFAAAMEARTTDGADPSVDAYRKMVQDMQNAHVPAVTQ